MPAPHDRFMSEPPEFEFDESERLVGYLSLRSNGDFCVSFEPAFIQALTPIGVEKIADCVRDYLRREVGGVQ